MRFDFHIQGGPDDGRTISSDAYDSNERTLASLYRVFSERGQPGTRFYGPLFSSYLSFTKIGKLKQCQYLVRESWTTDGKTVVDLEYQGS